MLLENLIASGHGRALGYTPRQAVAFGVLANRRRALDEATSLALQRVAGHGDARQVQDTIKKLAG